jgi:Tol biopolymer transport system component
MADSDGGKARQVTQDGWDAENPTMAANGEWIIYWSANPEKVGIWKIRPDGSEPTHLVPGPHYGPEVSPDGRYTTFLEVDPVNTRNVIRVAEVEGGRVLPIGIPSSFRTTSASIAWGRNRWTRDGRTILFVGENEAGLTGIFAQDFDPERDTADTRRPVAGFSPLYVTESFGVSPDGARLTIAKLLTSQSLMVADGVPGVSRARPRMP